MEKLILPTFYILFCGATAQLGLKTPPILGFQITQLDALTRKDSPEQVIGSSQRPLPTQRTANTRDKHLCHAFRGIRTRYASNQASANLRFRPHGHRDGNRNNGRGLNLTLCLRIVNYFIMQSTFIQTFKKSLSCAKCRLNPIAISWLRLKLQ